ncbi:MAG: hypothetical protein WAT74_09025 [Flavobacteriales bacterium]
MSKLLAILRASSQRPWLMLAGLLTTAITIAWLNSTQGIFFTESDRAFYFAGSVTGAVVRTCLLVAITFAVLRRLKKPADLRALLGASCVVNMAVQLSMAPWSAWRFSWMQGVCLAAALLLLAAMLKWAMDAPWRQTIAATVLVVFTLGVTLALGVGVKV